jgi:hypothetical protein
MFRALSFHRNGRGEPLWDLKATSSTRFGQPCEENKSFSKWTPGGTLLLTHEPGPVLVEDDYVYLDIIRAELAPEVPPDAIRLPMLLHRFEIDAFSGCFYVKAHPSGPIRGELEMQITNFTEPLLNLWKLELGERPRPIVVDITRVPADR